jgi:ribosome-binding protein aMBF1 (putative translation factor)
MISSLVTVHSLYPTSGTMQARRINPHSGIGIRNNCVVDPRQLREVLARNVQREMDKKGWKQPDLETSSKVGQSTISRIKLRQGAATLDAIAKIAGALGVQPWELLVDDDTTREAAYKRILGR